MFFRNSGSTISQVSFPKARETVDTEMLSFCAMSLSRTMEVLGGVTFTILHLVCFFASQFCNRPRCVKVDFVEQRLVVRFLLIIRLSSPTPFEGSGYLKTGRNNQ